MSYFLIRIICIKHIVEYFVEKYFSIFIKNEWEKSYACIVRRILDSLFCTA